MDAKTFSKVRIHNIVMERLPEDFLDLKCHPILKGF
jgi:hypothetical protein